MNSGILLTNIQRFSLHDGPGIRTTVFLKGCSLECPWCSNPENIISKPQEYKKDGVTGVYGRYMTVDEVVAECLKDKIFYEGKRNSLDQWGISRADDINDLPGGITFSGGEALLQIESLIPVISELHREKIHVAVETCLFCSESQLHLAYESFDFFYIDMKILDADKCKKYEKGNLKVYLENLQMLMSWMDKAEKHKPVVIRVPVIGTYTDDDENRRAVHELIKQYVNSFLKIELIKEHDLGEAKYRSLGMEMDYHGVSDCLLEKYKEELADLQIPVEICKI